MPAFFKTMCPTQNVGEDKLVYNKIQQVHFIQCPNEEVLKFNMSQITSSEISISIFIAQKR